MNRIEGTLLPGSGTDGYLRRATLGTIVGYLLSGAPNPADGYLRRWAHEEVGTSGSAPAFPTQYPGLRYWDGSSVVSLCLVATADEAPGMGGAPRIDKNGTTLSVYLVETTDPDASPVRIETTAGTKSVRLLT